MAQAEEEETQPPSPSVADLADGGDDGPSPPGLADAVQVRKRARQLFAPSAPATATTAPPAAKKQRAQAIQWNPEELGILIHCVFTVSKSKNGKTMKAVRSLSVFEYHL